MRTTRTTPTRLKTWLLVRDQRVDVGAVDEVTGITGVSHLFEHMAFKGTKTIGTTNFIAEKKEMEAQDRAYLALEAERQKGALADPVKIKKLETAFEEASKPLNLPRQASQRRA